MPGLRQQAAAAHPRPIGKLLAHVAFWQVMTFVMLLCAVWGLYFTGSEAEIDAGLYRTHSMFLTICIGLVGMITVGHTYLQQRRILAGLVISCSYCKRVRLDGSYWEQLETYLSRRSIVQFSHGICPDCLARQHPEVKIEDASARYPIAV